MATKDSNDIARIARSAKWHIFFGVEKGIPVYIGDDESMVAYTGECRANVAGFARAKDVLAALGLTIERTPFVQHPSGAQAPSNPLLAAATRQLRRDTHLPEKDAIDAFSAGIGKSITFYSARGDMYDGFAVYECFKQKVA